MSDGRGCIVLTAPDVTARILDQMTVAECRTTTLCWQIHHHGAGKSTTSDYHPGMARILGRHLAGAVAAALADTRVVAIDGARQAGKSTLVHALMKGRAGEERNAR